MAVATAASIVAGCAFFDPYVGLPAAPPEGWERQEPVPFAGNASREIARVEAVRQDYLGRMQQMGRTKAVFATGATVLTGWALYNALKPNAPGVTETPIGDKRRTVRLGAVIGTAYGLSQYAVNKDQESAYNDGYRALTCLLRQSAPLLMPIDPIDTSTPSQPDSARALETALKDLSDQILTLNQAVASARVGLAEGNAQTVRAEADAANALIAANAALPDKPDKAKGPKKLSPEELSTAVAKLSTPLPWGVTDHAGLGRAIDEAEKALMRARNALADGQALLKAVAGSGREIRERAHSIVSTVNGLIHDTQPDLQAADASLSKAQDIASGFLKIGAQTSGDQAETSTEDGKTSAAPPDVRAAATAVAAAAPAGSLGRFAALGGPGVSMLGSSLATVLLANAAAAAPPPAAPKAADPAASAPKPAAPAKPKPAPAPAVSTLTTSELQKISDQIQAALKAAKQREADEAKEKLIGGYVSKLKDLSKPKDLCVPGGGVAASRCDADGLARSVEALYAARRPVVATVLHFRSQAKTVRRISGCPSDAGVRVTPNETVLANAGDSLTFIVSQPKPGSPVAVLQGAQGDEQAGLKTESLGAAGMQAKVQFGAKSKGRYTLLTTDSTGEYSESVLIVVKPAPKKDKDDAGAEKPKPPASAAAD